MDSYTTIAANSEGVYREKMSKFMAFAFPVDSVDDARARIAEVRKKYFDARHVCWAYMIGADRLTFQSNDDGEPSGTAGKPILGQINSFGLTNVVIAVVRYFGGIKLGTSGLIVAYREAAREALSAAELLHCHEQASLTIEFPYENMNAVMQIIKNSERDGLRVTERAFGNDCKIVLTVNRDAAPALSDALSKHATVERVGDGVGASDAVDGC